MSKGKVGVLGGMLLIAGSCIGAGMLGLPIMTGLSGFWPSMVAFLVVWAFMTTTGLLLIESNGWFSKKVNLITMVGHTLGKKGKIACWILYLFLFYSVLVAYIAGIGGIVATIFKQYFALSVPDWVGSLFFVILFGFVVYRGTRPVDLWNRVLMVGKIAVFIGFILFGVSYIQPSLLSRSDAKYTVLALPILVIAFGFHNMIPSLTDYFQNNLKKVRLSIILGGLFALVVYSIWQVLVLGIVPVEGKSGLLDTMRAGGEASQSLVGILGASWVSTLASLLAFFAILTSFLAQALSLSHFLADGMKVSYKKHEEFWLIVLTLLPPLALAMIYPNIFLDALNFAGGICTMLLFGILPVMMVWKGRYKKQIKSPYQVFGGKPLLVVIFLFALLVIFFQISHMLKAPYLPNV